MKLNRLNSKRLLETQDVGLRNSLLNQDESDELNKEALEGFVHSDIMWSDVEHMDKRYASLKKIWGRGKWLFRGASILVICLFAGGYFLLNENSQNNKTEIKTTRVDKTAKTTNPAPNNSRNNQNDIELISEINNTPKNQFAPSIFSTTIPIPTLVSSSLGDNPTNEDSSTISMKTLQTKLVGSTDKLINAGQMGQEVFIYTLKTVDYRVYRKENTVIVDANSLLNGVSANQSNKSSSTENTERKEIAYFIFLSETMSYFTKGMFELASENFKLILEAYPDDVNAQFYGGLCALEKKDFRKSIPLFESVRIHNFTNFREEAEWKLLNAFILNKDLVKAKSLRDEIVQKNGFYAGQAKSISF